mgnify:CR=1 FL=1
MKEFPRHIVIILAFLAAIPAGAENLLRNPSFEEDGIEYDTAKHWKNNDPDDHGDSWGNATRVIWRAHDGHYAGAIRGTWAERGDYGGFWQEHDAAAGQIYRATAWFWADGNWTAEFQDFKLEFWNEDRTVQIAAHSVALHDIGELWVQRELEATAPEGTRWVRIAVNVGSVGENGALQVDDLSLEQLPTPQ